MAEFEKCISTNEIHNGVIIIKTQGNNPATSEIQKNLDYSKVFPTGVIAARLSIRFDDPTYYL